MTRRVTPEESGHYLRELLDVDFTDHQLAIATHPLTPQLVVAGAGSGKTMVMAARVVHAVACQGVEPGRVLGLTFTNKAAGELSTRVRGALARLATGADPVATTMPGDPVGAVPPDGDADSDDPLAAAYEDAVHDDLPTVGTYHSYAAGIVRDHALRIGREPFTALLTEATRWQLAMRVARAARGPFPHLDWTTPSVAGKALALAGEMAEHLVAAEQVRAVDARVTAAVAALAGPVRAATTTLALAAAARDELLELVAAYTAEKQRLDLIDFGDQVALAAEIAQTAPVVGAVERSRFGLVVLDEYQDTGVAQRLLLSQLYGGGHPVVAVGDPNQAIYGWRGASIGNLLRFGEHFPRTDATPVQPQPLMTSFRCGGRILAAANAIAGNIGTARGDARPTLDVPPLTAQPGRETDGAVVVARLETDADEAEWVADRVAAELAVGTAAGAVAVLSRRRADFARLHAALVDRDVPVEVVGLGGLLEMPEVADVVATLTLLVEPTANAAAIRLLTGPRWRIGVRDLAALGDRARFLATWSPGGDGTEPSVEGGLDNALQQVTASVDPVDVAALLDAIDHPGSPTAYSAQAWERLAAFRAEHASLRRLVGQPLVELVTEVVHTIGLDVEIEAETERVAVARAANLAAFVDHAAAFTGIEGESDLPAFLAYLAASADADNGLDVGAVSTADTVKLMTIHKAKGLEWDVVVVPALVHDVFPSSQPRTPWTRGAHVLPFELRGDAADLPRLTGLAKQDIESFAGACKADERDEERRLAYVAFTRPRRLLVASGYCWSRTRMSSCRPSTFLEELRALAPEPVQVDRWCDDPEPDATNPLAKGDDADIAWPQPPDPEAFARRQAAAGLVSTAIADLRSRQTAIALPGADGGLSWAEEARLVVDELQRERSTVRDVPLPRRLTTSQVVLLAEDPAELARMLARPLPARPQPQARRGSRFHAWVESLYGTRPLLDPDDLPGSGDSDVSDEELVALQQRFLADGWGERRPVVVEQPFELVVGGRLLRGRIDAVYPSGDGYDVVDYKTGSVPRDFAAASLQLSVYRLAWADLAHIDPERVTAGFLYVRTGELKRPQRLLSRDELATLLGTDG